MSPEEISAEVMSRHGLSTLHIFTLNNGWTVFGFREQPGGFHASVENGDGPTIEKAIRHLDARLIAGPINRKNVPWE